MAGVALKDLTLGYERRPAVHHLDGVFEAGRLHAVVGPNGSGKSTLLKGVAGLLPPLTGSIDLGG
ncbi:MAG: transporter, partial [Caulobacteraceae bacterium]|nr:transporter [Caulobacteraceae bacterium]